MGRSIFGALLAGTLAVGGISLTAMPATAAEQLLRCATSPVSALPGRHPPHFAQGRFYAPVRSAMFFSHSGSECRWKAGQRRHG